jgi:hypothetical protein
MANRDMIESASKLQTSRIDDLYGHILDQACVSKEESEVIRWHSSETFYRSKPSRLSRKQMHTNQYLSLLTSVIHIATHEEAAITPFHASFPDFVADPTRCSRDPPFCALVASEGHEMLALKCLEQMNRSLKYNICEVSKKLTVSRGNNSPDNSKKIFESLKYSCIYWASHFLEARRPHRCA